MNTLTRLLLAACLTMGLGAANASGPSGAAELIGKGDKLVAQGELAKAQQSYETALKADPQSEDAHMKLAGILLAQNKFTDAIQVYKNVIGIAPTNAKAFIGLGIAYLHSGDKSLTKAALEEALRLEPSRKKQLDPILAMLDESMKSQGAH